MANGKEPAIVRLKLWSKKPLRSIVKAARENCLHTVTCEADWHKTQCEGLNSNTCNHGVGSCKEFNVTIAVEEK